MARRPLTVADRQVEGDMDLATLVGILGYALEGFGVLVIVGGAVGAGRVAAPAPFLSTIEIRSWRVPGRLRGNPRRHVDR